MTGTLEEIDAVFMRASAANLDDIRALPFVAAAGPDAERLGAPIDTVEVEDFSDGLNTWDLDAINVTDFGVGRTTGFDGSGVYVAVLDTGLVDQWRQYFPEERIAEEFAVSFSGGGAERGKVSTQPNKWEHDTNSHGTHVTSTILGYSLRGAAINGVAPGATVIPVKVLHNSGFGWSSMVAAGITYVGNLKAGPLATSPVVINMSLGGPVLDPVEQAAIDFAISQGVIIVASAGNNGEAGMGFPGAYPPVISAAASGWIGEWLAPGPAFNPGWWLNQDVADPTVSEDFYITGFSSRALTDPDLDIVPQDLDVAAPGSWVVGPFNLQQGKLSYFFLGGTSMASPHVAGTVALMAEKHAALTAAQAESIIEGSAIPMADTGSRTIFDVIDFQFETVSWDMECDHDANPGTPSVTCDPVGAGLLRADAALSATP